LRFTSLAYIFSRPEKCFDKDRCQFEPGSVVDSFSVRHLTAQTANKVVPIHFTASLM